MYNTQTFQVQSPYLLSLKHGSVRYESGIALLLFVTLAYALQTHKSIWIFLFPNIAKHSYSEVLGMNNFN